MIWIEKAVMKEIFQKTQVWVEQKLVTKIKAFL